MQLSKVNDGDFTEKNSKRTQNNLFIKQLFKNEWIGMILYMFLEIFFVFVYYVTTITLHWKSAVNKNKCFVGSARQIYSQRILINSQ